MTLTGSWEAVCDRSSLSSTASQRIVILRRPQSQADRLLGFQLGDRVTLDNEAAVIKKIDCVADEAWCEVVCTSQVPVWVKAAELLPREIGLAEHLGAVTIRDAVECFKRAASPSAAQPVGALQKPRVQCLVRGPPNG
mmetsp:Transcript_1007/g.2220  ORF Transcript_1007/g.2220 Transcript_1007/m.2220 type:complete len:138 (-) Transcript_1007:8-421(-)